MHRYPKMWYTAEGSAFADQLWEETIQEFEFAGVTQILKDLKN